MALGVDYASGSPDPVALRKTGVHFVCRYLSTPDNPKNLTRAEARKLRAAGLDIVLVFEIDARRALGGNARGKADARSARAQASACGAPKNTPIYFAVDFDVKPAELAKVVSYIRGAASVLGHDRTGVYGGFAAVKACLDAGVCKYGWQTYAWSRGRWDPRAQLRQYRNGQRLAGIEVDLDRETTASDYGQWKAPKPKPARKPAPAPSLPGAAQAHITATGKRGHLIGRYKLAALRKHLPKLLARFKRVTLRKGS